MRRRRSEVPLPLCALVALAIAGCAGASAGSQDSGRIAPASQVPTLTPQRSGTSHRLQAISPVDESIVWVSGLGGTYAMTVDGGDTWRSGVVPGADSLEFRDVQAVSARAAYLLAAGPGERSRIYKTEDGGRSWSLQFVNRDSSAFYDCFAFWDERRGITMSDAVRGRFPAVRTRDGESWEDVGERLPPAQPGEAAFAASGTCVATHGQARAWIATGGAARARILATTDAGESWGAYQTPMVQGTATSGGVSVAFRDSLNGIMGGGDIGAPGASADNVARSGDGGRTWQRAQRVPFPGAVYGLAYAGGRTVVATGPGGAAWSPDEGDRWVELAGVKDYWAVGFASSGVGWLVGTEGRVLRMAFGARPGAR